MKKELARFSEAQPEVDEVSGYSLRGTIYIYAFEVAVALDDTLAGGIVGVSAGLTVVRQYHQAVVLVPIHSPLAVQTVVLHQCWIAIGIVSVMLMPYLRGSRGMVAVLVLIGKVVRLRGLCGVHLCTLVSGSLIRPKVIVISYFAPFAIPFAFIRRLRSS